MHKNYEILFEREMQTYEQLIAMHENCPGETDAAALS